MEKINILRVVNGFLAYLIFLFYLGDILVKALFLIQFFMVY